MDQQSLLDLQNGSDIRGVATQTPEKETTLTEENIEKIGYGFAVWLNDVKKLKLDVPDQMVKVAVGQDSRLSGNRIKDLLIQSLENAGITVFDVGLATTPAMFMATKYADYDADAAIMITASHLPSEYNGLKFFTKDGGAEHEDITFILEHGDREHISWPAEQGETIKKHLLRDYAHDLKEKIRSGIKHAADPEKPLKGKHIIVDAGNGAGGFFADAVLAKLGANTEGSQFLEPDGNFPNHVPNPDNKAAMKSIQDAVIRHQADMGIIFDTDVDRSALVDRNGMTLNRNNLIAVISAILIKENPGTTIVTNSTTTDHLKDFIEKLGGKQDRYLTGYRNVINRALALNEKGISTSLAIETSGHAALKENYFLDDGAYLIAKILIADAELQKEGKDFSSLIASLKQPEETDEVRFKILSEDVQEAGDQILKAFEAYVKKTDDLQIEPQNLEGVRVNTAGQFGSGWLLLRMSLHEPLLVLNLENDEAGAIVKIKEKLKDFFYEQSLLDASRL